MPPGDIVLGLLPPAAPFLSLFFCLSNTILPHPSSPHHCRGTKTNIFSDHTVSPFVPVPLPFIGEGYGIPASTNISLGEVARRRPSSPLSSVFSSRFHFVLLFSWLKSLRTTHSAAIKCSHVVYEKKILESLPGSG